MKKKTRVRLDLKLVELYAKKPRKDLEEQATERMGDILNRIGPHPISETERNELTELCISYLEQWLKTLYNLCETVWAKQVPNKAPGFLNAALNKVIKPAIENGRDSVNRALGLIRTTWTPSLHELSIDEWRPHQERLIEEWKDKIEKEIREMEHAAAKPRQKAPRGSPQRAWDVAQLDAELYRICTEPDYETAQKHHATSLTFKILNMNPELKASVPFRQKERHHIGLAQRLTMALHRDRVKKISTIQLDWKLYKPQDYRQKS